MHAQQTHTHIHIWHIFVNDTTVRLFWIWKKEKNNSLKFLSSEYTIYTVWAAVIGSFVANKCRLFHRWSVGRLVHLLTPIFFLLIHELTYMCCSWIFCRRKKNLISFFRTSIEIIPNALLNNRPAKSTVYVPTNLVCVNCVCLLHTGEMSILPVFSFRPCELCLGIWIEKFLRHNK